ncbi:MAG: M14 family metallocarboxypeptidase [Clostridia bacterium]|nr:M14 family metallocarboxypeptidase [Clostridia bacterium]
MTRITVPTPADSGAVRGMICALKTRYRFLDGWPIGASVCGRELYCLRVGTGRERILYAAAFHGQEWLTSLVLLRLCEELCDALSGDGRFADMDFAKAMAGRSLYLIPQVNPDGVEIALHGSHAAGGYAGAVAALGGDTPGLWQANACGVDLNHNYNAGWEQLAAAEEAAGITGPSPRQWRGPWPESEPETRAVTALCRQQRFRHVLALHSQGEEIYWQYGDRTPSQSRLMAEVMAVSSGYTVAQPMGLASHGGFKDWFICETGRPGFTVECGKGKNPLPLTDLEPLYDRLREMLAILLLM